MRKTWKTAVFVTALVVVVQAAAAAPAPEAGEKDPPPSLFSVTPLIGTDIGVDLAAGLQIESLYGIRLTGTVGWMPRAYAWALKEYGIAIDQIPERAGSLVEDALTGSFVVRGNLGVRPMPRSGLVIQAGYTYSTNDVSGLVAGLIERVGEGRLAPEDDGPSRTFTTSIHAHMIDAQVGWQWGIGRGFSVRAAIGAIVIVSTSTRVSPNYTPADPVAVRALTRVVERVLEDAGVGIVAPEASVFVGYTF